MKKEKLKNRIVKLKKSGATLIDCIETLLSSETCEELPPDDKKRVLKAVKAFCPNNEYITSKLGGGT